MGPTWLLANCHKEESAVGVLKKNMPREVEAAELLGSRNQGQRLGRTALPGHGTPRFLIIPSQLPGEADTSIPTAELQKGSVTCLRFNRPSGKVELVLFPLSWAARRGVEVKQ